MNNQIVAHWREAGRWWDGEKTREAIRFLDETGVLREETKGLTFPKATLHLPQAPDERPSYTVDYDVIKAEDRRKRRDITKLCTKSIDDNNSFAPLHCLSALSFGRSSMQPEQIAALAYMHGMPAVAITDYFSLAGVVDFCTAAKTLGIKPIIGATLEIEAGGEVVLLAKSQKGYANLSRLISHCHISQPRMFPLWQRDSTNASLEDIVCLTGGHSGPINRLLMRKEYRAAKRLCEELIELFGKNNVFAEIEHSFVPWEIAVNKALLELGIPAIAGGAITCCERAHFPVQDAMLCVETLCTVEEIIGRKPQRHPSQPQTKPWPQRHLNSEHYFRSKAEWNKLFPNELIERASNIANEFPENPLPPRPNFPKFCENPERLLREMVIKNARTRYKDVTVELKNRINGELERICRHGFASHFLAIWEACNWAEKEGILYSARGSAVDSVVSYCLGFSRIDAITHNLHFDRFLPEDGSKNPDIDIDFEAHRRDDVRNFFATRYGKENVATVAAVSTYQGRGIIRGIGKALMIPEETLGYLAKRLHGSVSGKRLRQGIADRPELRDSGIPIERFQLLFQLAQVIDGLPRHIGAHSSGVIVTETPLCETVPVMESGRDGVPIIQWDKYSAKKFFNKFDILCLRGHDVMAGTQKQIRENRDPSFDANAIAWDNEEVYKDFQKGNLIGTPQSASPAMRQAHIRLRSENLHDVSLVQAGIRPGVGGAVKINELIRRRRGTVQYVYPHPLFEAILGMSYGIIVFQEQVDQLLQAFCGYTSGEAEDIRDSIHKRRAESWDETIKEEVIERCLANNYTREIADHVFDLVSGFKGYGFAQGHALAFADLSIRCVYCQQHYPAEYFASLLSNQPAGYYGPGTIANEARIRSVEILPLDINKSQELFVVENGNIRVGLIQQFGLSKTTRKRILEERTSNYKSIFDFYSRVRPESDELEHLILSGFFDSLHPNRRALLWAMPDIKSFSNDGKIVDIPEPKINVKVEDFTEYERAVLERSMLSLDIKQHLMAFERERVKERGAITCAHAQNDLQDGQFAIVVGHAMRLRFPPTSSGKRVVFFDLEDETGLLNVTCFDDTYQKDGHAIICSPFVTLKGIAQERDGHIAFQAKRVFPYQPLIDKAGFAQERKAVHAEDFIHRAGR